MQFLSPYLDGTANPWAAFFAIVLVSFILEDAAAIIAALAAADGRISVPLAFASLFTGIAVGDVLLFALGRYAATHPWARRWIDRDRVRAVRTWIDDRLIATVISTRFLPGARLPTYSACGFLGLSFRRFALAVVLGTLVWTALLFAISLTAGSLIMNYLGPWRWPVGVGLILLIVWGGNWIARKRLRNAGEGGRSA